MAERKVAVIGAGFGGMTAAALLAKAGHRVSLFEQTGRLGGKADVIVSPNATLDTGPTLLTLPEVVKELFRSLDAEALLPRFDELPLQCEYVWQDGKRLSAFRDLERTAAGAAAFGPREAGGMRSFYSDAEDVWRAAGEPYLEAPFENLAGFVQRVMKRGLAAVAKGMRLGTLHDFSRQHFRSPELQQFAGRFATYAGASPYGASAAFALIPHIERAFGVHHVEGGMWSLVRALEKALLRLGATVHLKTPARWEALPEGGHLVRTALGEERFDAVVVNADPLASQGRAGEALALSGYVALVEANVRLPLPHHSVAFSADYRREFAQIFSGKLADDPTVYVCHAAASDPSAAKDGKSGLLLMLNAPPLAVGEDHAQWGGALADQARAQCLEKLDRLLPGLSGQVNFLGERTPADLALLGAPGGSIYGFLPHGRFGPFRRPKIRGDAPGLFFAGGGTHPGGGVPLVMLSGRFAAECASRHLEAA